MRKKLFISLFVFLVVYIIIDTSLTMIYGYNNLDYEKNAVIRMWLASYLPIEWFKWKLVIFGVISSMLFIFEKYYPKASDFAKTTQVLLTGSGSFSILSDV